MVTVDNLRTAIKAYPEIMETAINTSFRAATFKVGNKGIIAVEKDKAHATFALNQADAKQFLANPAICAEAITKNQTIIGVRVLLARLRLADLETLVAKSLSTTQS